MDLSAEDVSAILADGEGRDIEFKRGLPRAARTARTLCAFANTRGGILLVGITDKREVFGVSKPAAVVRSLRAIAAERLVPPLAIEVTTVALGAERVVACSVPLSAARPHHVVRDDGSEEIVVRVGASNRRATGPTLRALQSPRSTKGLSGLEREVLAWVGDGENATVAGFAQARNVGRQRARRAFIELERKGRLVAHGRGAGRLYELA